MHGLAGERAEARGEEQEPGEQLRSVFGRAQKLPSLLGEIDQDRGGVEDPRLAGAGRSEEHTSELQSLMRISYAVFCLKKKKEINTVHLIHDDHRHEVNTTV